MTWVGAGTSCSSRHVRCPACLYPCKLRASCKYPKNKRLRCHASLYKKRKVRSCNGADPVLPLPADACCSQITEIVLSPSFFKPCGCVKTLQNRPGPTLNTRRATPQSTGQADPSADPSSNQRTHLHAPHIEPPPSSKQHTQQLTPHSGSSARGPSTHPKS